MTNTMESEKEAALLLFEQLQRREDLNMIFRLLFKDLTPEELEVFDVTILNCINCHHAFEKQEFKFRFLLLEAMNQLLQTLRKWPPRFMNDVNIFCWTHINTWNGTCAFNIFVDTILVIQNNLHFESNEVRSARYTGWMCANDAIKILEGCIRNLAKQTPPAFH